MISANRCITLILCMLILVVSSIDTYGAPLSERTAYSITGATTAKKGSIQSYGSSTPLVNGAQWDITVGVVLFQDANQVIVKFDYAASGSVAIKNADGTIAASMNVSVILATVWAGTISNQVQTINYNTTPAEILATSYSTSCTYQWEKGSNGTGFSDIPGATGQNYQPGPLTSTTYFRRRACNFALTVYTPNAVVLVNNPPLTGGFVNSTQNVVIGNAAAVLSLTGITGGNGTYGFQWETSANGSNWTPVPNATTTQYNPGILSATTYYRVKISSGAETAYSSTAVIYINLLLSPGAITPAAITISSNTSPGILTAGRPSGGNGTYTYQWQSGTSSTSFVNILNATKAFFKPGNLTANTWYRCVVSSAGQTANTRPCMVSIGTVSPADLNFVRIREPNRPVTDVNTVEDYITAASFKQSSQYFDGLGRLLQTVTRQAGGDHKDLVVPAAYDDLGRQTVTYMPYIASSSDGVYKPQAPDEQYAFNNNQFSGEQYYFSQVQYEPVDKGRIQTAYAPGLNWVGSDRGVGSTYIFNTITDDVKKWNVTDVVNNWGTYNVTGYYPEGELYKLITTDEHGKQVIEFKDKEGRVILKKVQLTANSDQGAGSGYDGWLCTYNVYDVKNNLRLVIQPNGVNLLIQQGWNTTALNGDILAEQCFRYEYDQRNRMIRKKIPGAGEVWMVYDMLDRQVLMQDANMRNSHQWQYSQYDVYNRQVTTGLLTDNTNYNNLSYHTQLANASAAYPNLANYTTEELTRNFYDNYNWRSSYGNPLSSTFNTSFNSYLQTASVSAWPFAETPTQSTALTGLVTGTRIKVLGTTTYLFAVNFYDNKGRLIQTQSNNISGGTDVATTQYAFSGIPLVEVVQQQKAGASSQTHTLVTQMEYDEAGRMLTEKRSVSSTINGQSVTKAEQVIITNEYNALGQLKKRKMGNKPANAGIALVNQDFEYNIRGWLLSMNKDFVTNSVNNDQYFGIQLGYDKNGSLGTFSPQYNGNISGTIWKSEGDQQKRKFNFAYDAANRLKGAEFNQYLSGSGATAVFDKSAGVDFSVSNVAYDVNGNITAMQQKGLKLTGSTIIDDLAYSFYPNSNRLKNVIDASNDPQSKLGDFKSSAAYMNSLSGTKTAVATDYSYDLNGNLVKDLNKDIDDAANAAIEYNFLNLPVKIRVKNKGSIDYVYDALGNTLKKIVHETNKPDKTTLYLYGVYEDDQLQFFPHDEGRIRPLRDANGFITSFVFDYFLKDHLGNTRMVLSEEQKTDVYQAGMEDANRAFETALFGTKVNATAANKPGGFDSNADNKKVSLVNGATAESRVGPGVILKVMAGDKIKASTYAWYLPTGMDNTTNTTLPAIVTNLLGQLIPGVAGLAKGSAAELVTNNVVQPGMENFLSTQATATGAPKAFLNWVLLDEEQFKMVNGGVTPVTTITGTQQKQLLQASAGNAIEMTKNGYVYIYVSNESRGNVYFDDIRVDHIRGPLQEETHYYPYGLTMAGISSKAAGSLTNKFKFGGKELQSQEFSDGNGLELYDFGARFHDPQTGRWNSIDPRAEKYYSSSPYNFVDNNPISRIDPTGKDWFYFQAFGEKEAMWHWRPGDVTSYIDTKGNKVTTSRGFSHLVVFKVTGINSEGAQTGYITVFDNTGHSVFPPVPAFTGGVAKTNPVLPGNYIMRMDIRDPDGPQQMNADRSNPADHSGIQKINYRYMHWSGVGPTNDRSVAGWDIQGAYGLGRIRLLEVDQNFRALNQVHGYYLHGKLDAHNKTHGCVCDKKEVIFNYFWSGAGKNVLGKVPFHVQ